MNVEAGRSLGGAMVSVTDRHPQGAQVVLRSLWGDKPVDSGVSGRCAGVEDGFLPVGRRVQPVFDRPVAMKNRCLTLKYPSNTPFQCV